MCAYAYVCEVYATLYAHNKFNREREQERKERESEYTRALPKYVCFI